eukprot:m.2902 g.2902  ORF g.2902 m.2902 type:complete len:64 (-) comp4175_c0_seq1:150-341(-)
MAFGRMTSSVLRTVRAAAPARQALVRPRLSESIRSSKPVATKLETPKMVSSNMFMFGQTLPKL